MPARFSTGLAIVICPSTVFAPSDPSYLASEERPTQRDTAGDRCQSSAPNCVAERGFKSRPRNQHYLQLWRRRLSLTPITARPTGQVSPANTRWRAETYCGRRRASTCSKCVASLHAADRGYRAQAVRAEPAFESLAHRCNVLWPTPQHCRGRHDDVRPRAGYLTTSTSVSTPLLAAAIDAHRRLCRSSPGLTIPIEDLDP